MKYFLIIFILGIGTYSIRASFILLGHKISIHENIKLALSFLSITILPAMIYPSIILKYQPSLEINERLIASIIALALAYRFKNILITIIGGFVSLLILLQL